MRFFRITTDKRRLIKGVLLSLASLSFFVTGLAFAASSGGTDQDIGAVASQVTDSLGSLAKLITFGSYVAGMGFAVGAILKFKAHKDQPQQIPVGTPIALIFIAAALIFLPNIFSVAGHTLFGSDIQPGYEDSQWTNISGGS